MNAESPMQVALPDGRTLEVRTAGPKAGEVLLFHHGTPGAGLPFRPMAEAAASRGLRMVMYSRPGYGASTPQPGRRVIDAAADSSHVLDAVGASTFRSIGWSGGGPHALACAAALPDRCRGVASLAGVAPYLPAQFDWLAGMGEGNLAEFGLALQGADALAPFLEAFAADARAMAPGDLAGGLDTLLSEVDRGHVTGEVAEYLLASFREGLANGVAGARDDDLAFVNDWGFDLADVRSAAVWQGGQDRMVPFSHGVWLAGHIPAARRHLLEGEGHLSIAVGAFEQVLDDLLAM